MSMIAPEEIEVLRRRYTPKQPPSNLTKYSREWWDHYYSRKTTGDALVLKLIEAYEEAEEGYQELRSELDRVM